MGVVPFSMTPHQPRGHNETLNEVKDDINHTVWNDIHRHYRLSQLNTFGRFRSEVWKRRGKQLIVNINSDPLEDLLVTPIEFLVLVEYIWRRIKPVVADHGGKTPACVFCFVTFVHNIDSHSCSCLTGGGTWCGFLLFGVHH